MNIKELRKRLIDVDKSLRWLAANLGYSASYVYQVIATNNTREIKRIDEVLRKEEQNGLQ